MNIIKVTLAVILGADLAVCVRVTPFEELQSYYRTDIGV
jgi:hypothetical protein